MNCVIYKKNTDKIIYFVQNCITRKRENQKGNDFIGSNIKLQSINPSLFDIKWTNDIPTKDENNLYIEKVSDLSNCETFENEPVSTNDNINTIIKNKIKEKYSIEDEIKILRKKQNGSLSEEEWAIYNDFVEDLINKGKIIKDKIKGD